MLGRPDVAADPMPCAGSALFRHVSDYEMSQSGKRPLKPASINCAPQRNAHMIAIARAGRIEHVARNDGQSLRGYCLDEVIHVHRPVKPKPEMIALAMRLVARAQQMAGSNALPGNSLRPDACNNLVECAIPQPGRDDRSIERRRHDRRLADVIRQ